MEDVFEQIESLRKSERRVAMATLIATRGTSPKKEGDKMWVGEDGLILGSVTIGGCVDARVIEESEQVLSSSMPRVISMDLGDEDAWEVGFTCAGTIEVLVEPLDLSDDSAAVSLYRKMSDEARAGRTTVLATHIEKSSMKLLVFEDGVSAGTLGDAGLDREARDAALEAVQRRASRTVSLAAASGASQVFLEVHGPAPSLIVFGAGQVSIPLVKLARGLGFKTVVVDGRPRFANRERFPDADELVIGIPSEIAQSFSYSPATMVVLAAHDYKYDIPVLKTVLGSQAGYIGMLGSKRRGRAILDFLRESGVPSREIERVHVPTGLDIGAQTAAEIALSVLAEALAVRSGRPGTPMKKRDEAR